MSDTENQIQEEIEVPITKKDPRRVEQGKRLAAISREAKERKMRRKIMEEMESKKSNFNYKWWAFGGISLFGLLYLYFQSGKKEDENPVTIIRETPKTPPISPKKNFEEFD